MNKIEGQTEISNRGRGTYMGRGRGRGLSTKQLLNVIGVMTQVILNMNIQRRIMNQYAKLEEEEEDEMLLMAHMERQLGSQILVAYTQ